LYEEYFGGVIFYRKEKEAFAKKLFRSYKSLVYGSAVKPEQEEEHTRTEIYL
jgi:hypothetical protein